MVTVDPSAKVSSCRPSPSAATPVSFLSPLDRLGGQGVEQDPPQVAAKHLGTPTGAVVGLVEQHRAVLVEHARGLAALVDDRAELVGEAGRFERELPVVLVDVELAALRAGLRRGLRLVDRRGDAVDVEDAGEGEAAEARADDRDWCRHGVSFREDGLERCSISILEQRSRHVKMVRMATNDAADRTAHGRALEGADRRGRDRDPRRRRRERADLPRARGAPGDRAAARSTGTSPTRTSCSRRPPTTSSPVPWPTWSADGEPREAIRAIALGVFDAIDAHPWVGTQLSREPWQSAMLQIFEGIGGQLQALGVPERAQFDCASALVNYILGLAGQYAASARLLPAARRIARRSSRPSPQRWTQLDPASTRSCIRWRRSCADHDDREQFLAGIDLILAGITSRPRSATRGLPCQSASGVRMV